MAPSTTLIMGAKTPPKVHQETCTLEHILNSICLHAINASSKLEQFPLSNTTIQKATYT